MVNLNNVFNKYSIDCAIDVGANSSQYGAFLRSIGFTGWIVSFEPVKLVFEKLVENAKRDDKWIYYKLALGIIAEKKIINVFSRSVFWSFLDANDYSKEICKSLESVVPEEVAVAKLDDKFYKISDRTNCKHYYLKLDTQGYNLNYYREELKSINKVGAIQTELSLIHVYEEMPSPYEVLAEYIKYIFYIIGMHPVIRGESFAVIEYGCLSVKRPAQVHA